MEAGGVYVRYSNLKTHHGFCSGVTDGDNEKIPEELRNSLAGYLYRSGMSFVSTETVSFSPGLLIKAFPHKFPSFSTIIHSFQVLGIVQKES